MIRRLKEPFGKAGLTVAVIALVFALIGGAYAAGGLTKAQEKQVTKIAKRYAGKPGPAGAAGANGTNGKDGAAGTNGKDGTNGSAGEQGEQGEPGLSGWAETLPSGKTLAGQWSAAGWNGTEEQHSVGVVSGAVSFPFRVENESGEGPVVHFVNKGETTPIGCTGTVVNPGAVAGNLCVFTQSDTENHLPITVCDYSLASNNCPVTTADPTGFVVQTVVIGEGLVNVTGTWAVTAE